MIRWYYSLGGSVSWLPVFKLTIMEKLSKEYFISIGAIKNTVAGCSDKWMVFYGDVGLNWDSNSGVVLFIEGTNESLYLDHIKTIFQFEALYFVLTNENLQS